MWGEIVQCTTIFEFQNWKRTKLGGIVQFEFIFWWELGKSYESS